jgi:hypothetical protein
MRIQHENRTGVDRRHHDVISLSPQGIDRRWTKDQRSYVIDEDEIDNSAAARPENYWETLFNIPSEDCK